MKILVVCQYYYPEPFRITDICESLVNKGHNVTVLTGLPNYPEGTISNDYKFGKRRNEIINGVEVTRCFEIGRGKSKIKLFLSYFSYAVSASIKALSIKEKYDVILVNQLSPVMMGIPAIVYKKKNDKKILMYCLDLWPDSLAAGGINKGSMIYNVFFKISKWIYESADCLLVTSHMFESYFRDVLNVGDKKMVHLPQYAESFFEQIHETSYNSNLEKERFNFIFAGNIGEMQSVETIIKAANELKTNKKIVFHIVGDGSKLEACKKISSDYQLENIVFHGRRPVEEMPDYYNLADAMLVTLKDNETLSYTLPGKVQSYMAAGKPILGAINGEAAYIINESKCGYVCDAEKHLELSNIILKFCEANEKEQMSYNSYKYYIDNYSKDKFLSKLEIALKELEAT